MSEWTCPSCGGGFPEPQYETEEIDDTTVQVSNECPWCKHPLAGFPRIIEHEDPESELDLSSLGGDSDE